MKTPLSLMFILALGHSWAFAGESGNIDKEKEFFQQGCVGRISLFILWPRFLCQPSLGVETCRASGAVRA